MLSILQYVVNGIVFSSIIVLGAIGLSLVYSIANFANFAHGDLMTVGAFGALVGGGLLTEYMPGADVTLIGLPLSFYLAVVVGMAVAALVAIGTERLVYRPMDATPIQLLIASIGVALAYRGAIQLRYGAEARTFDVGRSGPIPIIRETIGLSVTQRHLVIVSLTIVLVVGLHLLLQYTTLGRKMRATADNPSLARVSGIRTAEVITAMWIIGAALAAAGGAFLGLDTLVRPDMGFDVLLVLFAAVILGGIGSVYGAVLGGFAIGMAHELTPLIPRVGAEYGPAVAFVIMVVILLVRPNGILGEKA